jgi:RNA recognition motif-containing protein
MTEKNYTTVEGEGLKMSEKSKGFGFVCFENAEDAIRGKEAMHELKVNDRKLYVNFAVSKDPERVNKKKNPFDALAKM